jgi:conjugative transposon TraM protein
METNFFLKDKRFLYLLLPVAIGALLYFLFTGTGEKGSSQEKNQQKAELFEPDANEDLAPKNKTEAYKQEQQEKLKKLREQEQSQVKGSDFYFGMNEQDEEYQAKVEKMKKNVFEEQILNEDENSCTTNFKESILQKLNNLPNEEEELSKRKEEKIQQRMQQLEAEEEAARQAASKKVIFPNPSEELKESRKKEGNVTSLPPPSPPSEPKTRPVVQESLRAQLVTIDSLKSEGNEGGAFQVVNGKRYRAPRLMGTTKNVPLINACVHGDQIIVNGGVVRMRLLENIHVGSIMIPANTIFYGAASITSDRLSVEVENIKYGDFMTPVSYIIYDIDAMQGLNLPNNLKAEITKQFEQGLVQGIRLPITSIGTVTSEVTSAINATTQVARTILGKSISQVKVHLKANYNMFIKEESKEAKTIRLEEEDEKIRRLQETLTQETGTSNILSNLL